MYMMTHPGKKLNFMGGEFGQLREWGTKSASRDWEPAPLPAARRLFTIIWAALNHIYLESPALWAQGL